MHKSIGILGVSVGAGLAGSGCIVGEECEVVEVELVITDFAADRPTAAGLEFCDPDGGPCVGATGSIAFLADNLLIDGPTEENLHGAATGSWDVNRYFAVGDAGTVILARGGYDGWDLEEVETTEDLYAVATLTQVRTVVAVGETVSVWSDDGGDSWNTSSLPDGMFVDHLVRVADDRLLAGGAGGQLWSTGDGQDWSPFPSPTQDPISSIYSAFGETLLADAAGRVFSAQGEDEGEWEEQSAPGDAPVISFSGLNLIWALRSDGTLAYRFLDEAWERSEYEADGGVVLSTGEYQSYYDHYALYEYGWLQSHCVVGDNGEVHSTTAWLDPVIECKL